MHPNVQSSTIYNSQDMEPTYMSISIWMNKDDVVYTHTHTHTGILLSHKKEWNNAICSNMDGPRDYHTKQVSQRQISYDITYMLNLIFKMTQKNLFTK